MSNRPSDNFSSILRQLREQLSINNISSLQLFHAMQFGTAILIGILLAKSGLPTSVISVYEALMFIASLFVFFWVVGGQNAILQLFPKLEGPDQKGAFTQVFLLFTLVGLFSGGILFLFKDYLSVQFSIGQEMQLLELLALFLALNSPTFLIHIFYLLLKKYKAIVWYGVVVFSIQIAVVAVPICLGWSLREVMIGFVGWALFKFIWCLFLLFNHAEWKLNFGFLNQYLKLAFPLLLLGLVGKSSDYLNGFLVTVVSVDEGAFAVFRYGARELPLAVLLVSSLVTSLIPVVAADPERGLHRIKDTTRKLSHFLFPISIVSMLAAPFLFPILFNPDFKESARIFNIFTLLLVGRILLPQVVAMGHGKNYALTLGAFIELGTLAIFGWWWGRWFGLQGIAFAAAWSYMVNRTILIGYNWKVLGIRPSEYIDWGVYSKYSMLLIASFLVSLIL